MPNGRTHDRLTMAAAGGLFAVLRAVIPAEPLLATSCAASCLISGLLFSPDLDVEGQVYRRWGSLRLVWWPYKEAIPHRHWLSHGLVIGPLFALAYFLLVANMLLAAVLFFSGKLIIWFLLAELIKRTVATHPDLVIAALVGFVLGGAVHTIPDWFVSGVRRRV